MERYALFLDRDGVINVDYGYVYERSKFEFIKGIFDLCSWAQTRRYLIFVITNQAGIARGYYTEHDFHLLTDWMCEEFRGQGINIEKVYYCPYHPINGLGHYRQVSYFRKPRPGMILAAAEEFDIDLSCSILVGDKVSDIEAGLAAGIKYNFLLGQHDCLESSRADVIMVKNLKDVMHFFDPNVG